MQVQDARRVHEAADLLAAAVAAIDLGSMLPATQRELVALGERIERTGRTLKSMAAAKVADSTAWRGEGDRTPEDWLARTTGTTRAEAAKELQCGRDLQLVPEIARAATAGELSVKQTEAIAGAAAADPSAAPRLLVSAKDKGLRELQDECRATRTNADPDPEATRARIHAKRSYRTWTDPDGTGHLHLTGPNDVIARVDNAVRHRCERLFRDARRDGRREPTDAYAFDAATELLTGRDDGTPPPAGADAKVIVRVDLPALLRGRAVDGETCEIAGLGPIPASIVREWMDNAFLAAIVTKGTEITKVVHLGVGSPASSAPRCSGATRSALARAATTASASSTTTSRTGPTPTPPAWEPDGASARPATASRPWAGTSPPPTLTASAHSPHPGRWIPHRARTGPSCMSWPKASRLPSAPAAERSLGVELRAGGG